MIQAREIGLLVRSLEIAIVAGGAVSLLGLGLRVSGARMTTGQTVIAALPLFIPTHVFAVVFRDYSAAWLGAHSGFSWLPVGTVLALKYSGLAVAVVGSSSADSWGELAGITIRGRCWTKLHLTIPKAAPALYGILLAVGAIAVGDYTIASVMQVPTYTGEIFVSYAGLFDSRRAVLLSGPLVLFSLTAMGLAYRSLVRAGAWQGADARVQARSVAATIATVGIAVAALLLPLLELLHKVGNVSVILSVLRQYGWEICASIGLALVGATSSLLLGLAVGERIARLRPRRRALVELGNAMLLGSPAIVTGIVLSRLLSTSWGSSIAGSPFVIAIGYGAKLLPFAILLSVFLVRSTPSEEEDAATVLGKSWWWRLRYLRASGRGGLILGYWGLLVALALDDVATTIFIVPPSWQTTSLRIYELTHYGARQNVAALCLIQVLFVGAIVSGGRLAGALLHRYRMTAVGRGRGV